MNFSGSNSTIKNNKHSNRREYKESFKDENINNKEDINNKNEDEQSYIKNEFEIYGSLSWSADDRYIVANYMNFVMLFHISSRIKIKLDSFSMLKCVSFHPLIPEFLLFVKYTNKYNYYFPVFVITKATQN